MHPDNLLIVADSDHGADMRYAVRMFVPDPFIFLRIKGRSIAVVNDLEVSRARREARHCRVHSLGQLVRRLAAAGEKSVDLACVIASLLRERRLRKITVPASFPLGLARRLSQLGIEVRPAAKSCFPEREFKTADEVKKISAVLVMAEVGMAEGIQTLKSARIARSGRLMLRGLPLTSDRLRAVIDSAIVQAGGVAEHTIVAGGAQACDPHERGHGILRANQPIIIDIFPRSQKTGYYGDITRTVVKGRASDAVRKIFRTVERGQEIAFDLLRHQTPTQSIHLAVSEFFPREGFKTRRRNGRMEGFIHGTGHGLGLEVHEAPAINASSNGRLRAGQVVTLEPGLYYPGVAGVRLEDVALVTRNGARKLTKFEKQLEI